MIHALKKRAIRQAIKRDRQIHPETRDAIIWDVIAEQRVCRVKFQGSDTLMEAIYPKSYHHTPSWMKAGNAVRVTHTGGRTNRLEVSGPGIYVPTPIPGSSSAPTIDGGSDAVLTGGKLHAMPETPSMNVWVETGTYRIAGTIYTLGSITMSESNTVDMDSGIPFDTTAGTVSIAAAHATQWRIDSIVVASDGVIDVVQGDNAASNPTVPSTPAGHILLGTVKVPPGTTAIYEYLVNSQYVDGFVSRIVPDETYIVMDWDDASQTILVELQDQYGAAIKETGYWITGTIVSGSGGFIQEQSEMTVGVNPTTGQASFIYFRDDNYQEPEADEEGPVLITFTLVQNLGMITSATAIQLKDAIGGYIYAS